MFYGDAPPNDKTRSYTTSRLMEAVERKLLPELKLNGVLSGGDLTADDRKLINRIMRSPLRRGSEREYLALFRCYELSRIPLELKNSELILELDLVDLFFESGFKGIIEFLMGNVQDNEISICTDLLQEINEWIDTIPAPKRNKMPIKTITSTSTISSPTKSMKKACGKRTTP